jgi:hypothetical protein
MQWKQVKAQQIVINEQKQQHLCHYKKKSNSHLQMDIQYWQILSFFDSDSSSELIY